MIVCFCLIQGTFYSISKWFGYSRPFILIEYFIPIWGLNRLGWKAVSITLLPVLVLEIWLAIAQVYLLYSPLQWISMFKYIGYLRGDFLFYLVLLSFAILLIQMLFLRTIAKLKIAQYFIFFSLVLILINFIPSIGGFYNHGQKLYRDHSFRLLGSSSLMLYWMVDEPGMQIKTDEFDDVLTPWRGKNGESYKPILTAEKTLLILAESWGEPKNSYEKNMQISSLQAIGINMDVNTTISTSGSTVSAEMRELCRLNNKSVVIESNLAIFKDCLPNRAKNLGYKTYSIHAASGGMYDRLNWYPKIGFEHSEFYGTIPQDGIRKCKSMPGLCDVDMMEHVFSQIKNEKKIFYYWLTLNSHFPYDERDIFISNSLCSRVNLSEGSQRCRYFLLQQQFFESLANYIKNHKSELAGVQVIVVGDHNPPFFKEEDRDAFTDNKVPLIAFTIK